MPAPVSWNTGSSTCRNGCCTSIASRQSKVMQRCVSTRRQMRLRRISLRIPASSCPNCCLLLRRIDKSEYCFQTTGKQTIMKFVVGCSLVKELKTECVKCLREKSEGDLVYKAPFGSLCSHSL